MKKIICFMAMLLSVQIAAVAQVTSSGINGKVTSSNDAVIGATVTAKHVPSGTTYRAVTNIDGRFAIQGMRVGGPYTVEISYIGTETKTFNGIQLRLGETQDLSCNLRESASMLQEVVVTSRSGLDATKTGAAQSFNAEQINNIPSVTHSISDIARMNPLVSVHASGAMSFAGINNRFNSFQIDGAINNDAFGLSSTGQNGGQTNTNPMSMETIEQIQINIAPFDVRQSGFTGGAINAITKSGTNEFHGSVYGNWYNEKLIGRHYKRSDGTYSNPYQDEHEWQYGITLGGPVVKDKLFFFANYERFDQSYPVTESYNVDWDRAGNVLNAIKDMAAMQGVTYNSVFNNQDIYRVNDKGGLKLDWNINDNNKLVLRWSMVDAKRLAGSGGASALYTADRQYRFTSLTHSVVAELQSRLSATLNNEFRATYVRVRDKRTSGAPFPSISVSRVGVINPETGGETNASVGIGNESNSMANGLKQDVYTFEDNLTWLKGNHTITLGTHNEFYKFANLYISNLYGTYSFSSYDDFMNYYNGYKAGEADGKLINSYALSHADVAVTGDPRWESPFSAGQLGAYLQDKWDATSNLQLTYGLRVDIPLFLDRPAANTAFNIFAAGKGWNFETNRRLKSTPMLSPRLGFRWNALGNNQLIVRGGVGVFTGRIPFVWLSNSFAGTGIQLKSFNTTKNAGIQLLLDPNNQQANEAYLTATQGSQEVSVFEKNFKFTQTLRANLGIDFNFLGINWTAEALYSKALNDIFTRNIAYEATDKTVADLYPELSWLDIPMMQRVTTGTPFTNVYALYNTSKGYTYNLSLKGEKHFRFGLDLAASYTYSKSKSISSITSSTAYSTWSNNTTHRSPNDPELANSAFNIPHQIKASAFYHFSLGSQQRFTTTVGLIYTASSGSPYLLRMAGSDMNGDNRTSNELMYIPTDEQIDRMTFVATSSLSEDDQRANLKQWLANQKYLKDHRGQFYERYADNTPFEHHFDLHIAEKIKTYKSQALEIAFDVMNVGNMLNKDWGRTYGDSGYVSIFLSPLNYQGNGKFQFTQSPTYNMFNAVDLYSRWRGQISLKYIF